jgi:hypothetical protein
VEFEPTPAQEPFDYPLGGAEQEPEGPLPLDEEPAAGPAAGRLAGLILAAAAVLALAGWLAWQRLAAGEATARGQALGLYRRIRASLARAGLRATPSTTPDEFLRAAQTALAGRPRLQAAVDRATGLFRRAAYSPHPVSGAEAAEARQLWQAARGQWIAWVIRKRIHR